MRIEKDISVSPKTPNSPKTQPLRPHIGNNRSSTHAQIAALMLLTGVVGGCKTSCDYDGLQEPPADRPVLTDPELDRDFDCLRRFFAHEVGRPLVIQGHKPTPHILEHCDTKELKKFQQMEHPLTAIAQARDAILKEAEILNHDNNQSPIRWFHNKQEPFSNGGGMEEILDCNMILEAQERGLVRKGTPAKCRTFHRPQDRGR